MLQCLTWCETQNRAQQILRFSRFCRAFALSLFPLFLACPVNAEEKAEPERRYAVNIPKQNLADALNSLSEQTQQLLLFPYQIASTLESEAVSGEYSLHNAMAKMLEGTGYTGGLTKKGVLMILLSKSDAQSPTTIKSEPNMQSKQSSLRGFFASVLGAFTASTTIVASAEIGTNTIEEVIVTAERKEASVQKTPIAMSVFTSDQIERDQLLDTRDLAQLSPSLTFNQALAGSQIYIRGVGQGNPITGSNPGVALHIDGVYLGHPYTNNASFYDAERFEVLRGPQGTLYGRNSTGGSINIITKSPVMEPELRTTFGVGSHGRTWLKAAGNTVLTEDLLAIRGSVVIDSRDGYVDNLTTGKEPDDRDLKAFNVAALYTPSDTLAVLLKGDYQKDERLEKPISHLKSVAGSGIDPTLFGAQTSNNDASKVYNDSDRFQEDTFWGANATLTWDLGTATVKSITAYRESDNLGGPGDNDGTSFPVVSIESDTVADELTQELTVSGTARDDRLEWITGVNYYKDDVTTVSLSVLPFLTNLLPPVPSVTAIDGSSVAVAALAASYNEELTSKSLFAQFNYSATDSLRLTLGARYTQDKKTKFQTVRSNITPPASQCESLTDSKDWSAATWKLGADLTPNENTMFYGSISTGFKAGGFNSGACDDDYDEEKITAYEVGFKSRLLDERLMLNGSVFFYDYRDLQVRAFQGAVLQIANAGESEISGFELDLLYQPNNSWRFDAGIAYLDAEFAKALLDDAMIPGIKPEDVSGNRMERAPELKYSLGAQYTHGNIDYRYELSYSDDIYVDSFENDFAKIDSHTEQNIRVIWRPNGSNKLSIQAFVENLTDEEYADYLIPTSFVGGVAGAYAPPRTWGMLVNWDLL